MKHTRSERFIKKNGCLSVYAVTDETYFTTGKVYKVEYWCEDRDEDGKFVGAGKSFKTKRGFENWYGIEVAK